MLSQSCSRLAVFGGSFDPPHHGHRALVECALAQLEPDALWIIPVGLPVHRTLSGGISPQLRMQWVVDMFADLANVTVIDWEVNADMPTPSCRTLERIHQQYRTTPLFLMGMDAWTGMESWLDYPIHRELCNVAVFSRVGVAPTMLNGWEYCELAAWRKDSWCRPGRVLFMPDSLPDVSATALRKALQTGDSSLLTQSEPVKQQLQQWYGHFGE